MSESARSAPIVVRFRRWTLIAIAAGVLLYLGFGAMADVRATGSELERFDVRLLPVILALTLCNYGLRFAKWHWLLGRLGVRMALLDDAWNFAAGLAMVISPGKVGELVKPWVVRARTGAPMAMTVPALVTERLTDGIAMLLLAAVGVGTYAADRSHYVWIPAGITVAGLLCLSHEGLALGLVRLAGRLPGLARIAPKMDAMVRAARTCLSPLPLLVTVALSVVAWGAECVGYLLVFRGLGVDAGLGVATFLYAFATVAGGAMPGGLGIADGALFAGAQALVPGITAPQALAAALLVRLATLWIGVAIGAVALFRVSAMLGEPAEADVASGARDSAV